MPKTKVKTRLEPIDGIILALIIIVLGWFALRSTTKQAAEVRNDSSLKVKQANDQSVKQGQEETGAKLQGAAKVNDLIKGRPGSNIQNSQTIESGTDLETLLKNSEIETEN